MRSGEHRTTRAGARQRGIEATNVTSCFCTWSRSCGGANLSRRRMRCEWRTSRRIFELPRDLQRDRARNPDEREPPECAHRRAAERVEQVKGRQQVQPAADRLSDHRRDDLEDGDPDERSDKPDERAVARMRREEVRSDARSDHRAGDEPREREHGADQPALVATERGDQRDEPDQDPVEAGHRPVLRRAAKLPCAWGRSSVG